MTGSRGTQNTIENVRVPASGQRSLGLSGNFMYCLSSSQATFLLGFDADPPSIFLPGLLVRDRPGSGFNEVTIANRSTTDELVLTLIYGKGDIDLKQFKFLSATSLTSSPDESVAATTTEQILPANADRRKAIIANPFANAREFRIGDSAVTASRGIEVPPGARIELETTASIHAHNPDAAAMSISVLEIAE